MINTKYKFWVYLVLFILCFDSIGFAEIKKHKNNNIKTRKSIAYITKQLMDSYPGMIAGYKGNHIIWYDSTTMPYISEAKSESKFASIANASLSDQFSLKYTIGKMNKEPIKNEDPGRLHYEPFFYKMYGKTEGQVRKNLVEITWCPKLSGQKILVTKINGVDKKVRAISKELDKHPELKKYIAQIGGTFYWRTVKGSTRQSSHSFGTTIDLNGKFSDYWQWNCKCTDEETELEYKNQIPQIIVDIFEKNGFIWGGKWYHYDTMHFEYRPELVLVN